MDGNLTATFLTIKSILPGMKARKAGSIITLSSAAARRPHPGSPIPYAAAKAGIQILTQDVAAQVGPFGIRVNCLAPETILTERNDQRIPDAQKQALVEQHPLGVSARRRTWPARRSSSPQTTRAGLPASSWTLPAAQ